ncbi:MAG: TonB-dependent receptor [Haliangiales bacterium]
MSYMRNYWMKRAVFIVTLALCVHVGAAHAQQDDQPPDAASLDDTPSSDAVPADQLTIPDDAESKHAPADKEQVFDLDDEVVLITGSLIDRHELNTPSPMTVLTRNDLTSRGVASLGPILQSVTAQSNAVNLQFNNGGSGVIRVALRGLGAKRTLVLVNGRRHVPGGNGANSSVDLTAIPLIIIERVEILKAGASPTYGSDAVAGVYNLITRDDFEGVEFSLYTGTTGKRDGVVYDASVASGYKSDDGHIVFAAGYYQEHEIIASDREYSRFHRSYLWHNNDGTYNTVGSIATPNGTLIDVEGTEGNALWQDVATNSCRSGICARDPDSNSWRNFDLSGTSDTGEGDNYNYQTEQYLTTPSERNYLYSSGNHKFHRYLRGFFEASYTRRHSQQQLAPEGIFTNDEGITVSRDNLYNPFGRDFSWMARRMIEGRNRTFTQNNITSRLVTGLEGELPESLPTFSAWHWDLSYNFGRTQSTQTHNGRYIRDRVARALGPSFLSASGIPTCGIPGKPIADCVPLNLFDGAGTITPEMLNYIQYTGTSHGYSRQQTVNANLRGKLFTFPWRGGAVLALGAEYRAEAGANIPESLTATRNTTGTNKEPTDGAYKVRSAFAELSLIPIASLPAAEWVELSAAARTVDYDTKPVGRTWKLSGLWRFGKGVTARGTYSTTFRVPSLSELYSGRSDDFPSAIDPCNQPLDPNSTDPVVMNCLADGVPVTGSQSPTSRLRTLVGGNPDLDAETAGIFTAGVVYEPPIFPGLSFTLDYYNLSINNTVETLGADVILNSCYSRLERKHCHLIFRDENAEIDSINNTLQNAGDRATAGIDFNTRYRRGPFHFNLEGSWLQHFNETQADGTFVEGKNVYDLGAYPTWKFNLSTAWKREQWSIGANMRYIHSFKECGNNNIKNKCFQGQDPDGNDRMPPPDDSANGIVYSERKVDAVMSADIFASYTLRSPIATSRLTIGVNNVLNPAPPAVYNGHITTSVVQNGSLPTSDASTYDYKGRYFYARFIHSF